MYCLHCGRKLVSIGNSRKNGKNHSDWDTRKYHKKCFIKLCEIEMLKNRIENFKNI